MKLYEAIKLLNSVGYLVESNNQLPIIICADMGVGKTTFVEEINSNTDYNAKDLEVSDIPGIWDEPDENGNMQLISDWESKALDKIKTLKNTDFVVVTSDKKLVLKLLQENIKFFLIWKKDEANNMDSIIKRTSIHFSNVVNEFKKYIDDSIIDDNIKDKMFEFAEFVNSNKKSKNFIELIKNYITSNDVIYNLECIDAIPEDVISSPDFSENDNFRHWHDMFKFIPSDSGKISIAENNINEHNTRIKFFNSIHSPLCTKIVLDKNQFLTSPTIFKKIVDSAW